jgi:GDP-D-mannose 3',5'-epimerase
MKKAIVLGAGGFIGNHMVNRLKEEGYRVRGVDVKYPEFSATNADEFYEGDLRDFFYAASIFKKDFDEVYQFAADMGGATYINGGLNDARVMSNSVLINTHTAMLCSRDNIGKVYFPSSACVYGNINNNATCIES